MRRESEFARENLHRSPGGDLLQREGLKVVNMLDLARELSGTPDVATPSQAPVNGPASFWKTYFAGWSSATPLTVTIPPPPGHAAGTAVHAETLPQQLTEDIRRTANEIGVPVNALFVGTWALLLHRYSGEDDIVFGVVKSCIERDDQPEPHIVPVRVILQSESRARGWFRDLADRQKEASPFEFTSLPQIRAAAGLPADAALFQAVLSVGNDFDPAAITAVADSDTENYPLVAAAYPGAETRLSIGYSKTRFSEAAIQLMLSHWSMLLQSVTSAGDELLSALRMVTPAEVQRLVVNWNATDAPYPATRCVPQLFEAQVDKTPDATAVEFGEASLTYRELNYRANTLAHHLRDLGAGPDEVVGICMDRSVEAVIAVLGVLKSGAAYLPLDPNYPPERLQFMLADSAATTLITQERLKSVFPQPPDQVIMLDSAWFEAAPSRPENPAPLTTPESLAYLIYTSGSTGKPKGVAMIHRALVNLIDWQTKQSAAETAGRTLQFTSLSFDVSFQEIFSTWCQGGTLVLITAELRLSPRDLWQFIVKERISRLFLPFVALQQLADAAAAERTLATALHEIITAGEQLQVTPRLRELISRHPQTTLHNHYGPSETHVVTALALEGNVEAWPALPSIGWPIQNTSIFLLDRHRVPVPVGIPGELYIGGAALARGYFERPDVTAEKFVPNPFGPADARMYRTGDLARYLPDGQIEFLGRIDHQVKIRGYRVELGEVEAALNKLNGVRECVVMAREREAGLKQLAAYIVPQPGMELQPQNLRQELKHQLPDYMVPSAIVLLEKLPLTPSGKVDRRSLPAPDEKQQTVTASPAAGEKPWLPLQLQLVQIWEEMLGVRPIGIRDNFFDLGGHSLLAVRMMDRVEQVTGKKIPVTELFQDATIAHLAEFILQAKEQAASPVIELSGAGSGVPVYFLHGDIIGGGFYARDLARLLGPGQPFFVLPPSGMDNGAVTTVEAMTEIHLGDLLAHRPHGPYVLGGFCIGALIAYEMAVRLRARGEVVSWVALIDPQLPSRLLRAHYRATEKVAAKRNYTDAQKLAFFARGHKVLYRLREIWNSSLREKAEFIAGKVRRVLRGKSGQAAELAPAESSVREAPQKAPAPGDGLFSDAEQRVLAAFHWILSGYTPPAYDGRTTIFLTDEQHLLTPFLARRWRAAAPQIEVERIPGKHLGAITTDVESFAARLKERLEANVGVADGSGSRQSPVAA